MSIAENATKPSAREAGTRRWQRFLLAVLTRLSLYLQRAPREKALRFGERFGALAYLVCRYFVRRPYDYAQRNLLLTGFPRPNATKAERDAFIRRVFLHFGKGCAEFMRIGVVKDEDMISFTDAEGMEHFVNARKLGKGVVFVSGHFGNWEYIARYIALNDLPLTVVAREPEEPGFAAWVKNLREEAGYAVLYRGASLRGLLRVLKENEIVGILADQNGDDLFVPFLGLPAGTTVGPATLALRTGAALIIGHSILQPDGRYRTKILPPLDTHSTGDRSADIDRITREMNCCLEEMVRECPEQWLWLHNRWKSSFDKDNRARAWENGEIPPEIMRKWKGVE